MASSSPLECGVCNENFNEEERCPRILPCYHHLCNCCIEQLIENSFKICPFCRRSFKAQSAKDVQINNGVLDLVIFISQQISQSSNTEEKGGILDSSASIGSVYSTENASNSLLNACRDIEKIIDESVHDMGELTTSLDHQNETISSDIIRHFTDMMATNDSSVQELKTREDRIMDYKKELKKKEEEVKILKERLRTADHKFTEDDGVRQEVEEANAAIGVWVAGLRDIISQDTELCTKVSEDIRMTIAVTEAVQEAMCSPRSDEETLPVLSVPDIIIPEQPSAPTISFLGQLSAPTTNFSEQRCQPLGVTGSEAIVPNMAALNIPGLSMQMSSIEMLRHMTESSKKQVEEGNVYAIQYDGSRTRFAKISITRYILHLHNLQDELPPHGVTMLDYNDVLRMTSHSNSATAFIELAICGSVQGRIYIDLSHTFGGKNFGLLCTGEKGPSYVNTRFLVCNARGRDAEAVQGGDYEENSGKGGKTLVTGLNLSDGVYKRKWEAGTVRGYSYNLFGQFYINTRDRPGTICHGAIGKVIKGLDLLKDLIDYYDDITCIYIKECGIVLPCPYLSRISKGRNASLFI